MIKSEPSLTKKNLLLSFFTYLFLIVLPFGCVKAQSNTVEIPSKDGLMITVDEYLIDAGKERPIIVLCHQAMFSRGAYTEIAPWLNKMGFSCIAIDQRSGLASQGVRNETAKRAKKKGLGNKYIDAEQDIVAAVEYAYKKTGRPVLLWGSSYSASLVLKVASETEMVHAVLSYSPGEYFGKKLRISDSIQGLNKPCYITSSKGEADQAELMWNAIKMKEGKVQFVPNGAGKHGSKALWSSSKGYEEYRKSVMEFLKQFL